MQTPSNSQSGDFSNSVALSIAERLASDRAAEAQSREDVTHPHRVAVEVTPLRPRVLSEVQPGSMGSHGAGFASPAVQVPVGGRSWLDEQVEQTTLGCGIEFHGSLRITNGSRLVIRGDFAGDVMSNGDVIIERDAVMRGQLSARNVCVRGAIDVPPTDSGGKSVMCAQGELLMETGSSVRIDQVHYGRLEVRGARINAHMMPL